MLQKIFFAIVILLAAVCVSGAIFKPEPKTEKVEVKHVVHRGQTLWGIAGELQEQYGDRRDIREVLHYTRKANGIDNGHIHPGQVIVFSLEATK